MKEKPKCHILTCTRCGYVWISRKETLPKNCANGACNSPYWDKERKIKKEEKPL